MSWEEVHSRTCWASSMKGSSWPIPFSWFRHIYSAYYHTTAYMPVSRFTNSPPFALIIILKAISHSSFFWSPFCTCTNIFSWSLYLYCTLVVCFALALINQGCWGIPIYIAGSGRGWGDYLTFFSCYLCFIRSINLVPNPCLSDRRIS